MHERRFNREITRLRDPERVERLEVDKVVSLCLEHFPEVRGVLDIGTGSGLFAEAFAARNCAVSGVDVNPEMLVEAQKYVPNGTFKAGIAEALPFETGEFDLVFFGLVLHETDDTLHAVREAKRVSTQGVAVLEWPDENQSFGPPRTDRISAARMYQLAQSAGLRMMADFRLKSLQLYLLCWDSFPVRE